MAIAKLTTPYVANAVYEKDPRRRLADYRWDEELRGFALRVLPRDRFGRYPKRWTIQYTTTEGRRRFMSLGDATQVPLSRARAVAREHFARIQLGEDPLSEKRKARARRQDRRGGRHVVEDGLVRGATMRELYARYLEEHAIPHKKPRSVEEDRRQIETYLSRWRIPPKMKHGGALLAAAPVLEVTRDMMVALHQEVSRRYRTRADALLDLLATMLRLAEDFEPAWRRPGSNPATARKVVRNGRQVRDRILTRRESQRLGLALAKLEGRFSPYALAALRVLYLTPARMREILHRRWSELDTRRRIFVFDQRKTDRPGKKRRRHVIPLSAPAVAVISGLEKVPGNPYIFPGKNPGQPLAGLQGVWKAVCREGELEDLRIHDLKHNAVSAGLGLGLHSDVMAPLAGSRAETLRDVYTHHEEQQNVARAYQLGAHLASLLTDPG